MSEKFLAIGSAGAAFLASLCCLGPLVLGGLGLGAVLVATFAPLRPYFLAVSAGLLALGFYFVYRKPQPAGACVGEVCAPEGTTGRAAKAVLWLATVAVAALAFFPAYGAKLVGTPTVAAPAATTELQTVELKIDGMSCEACAGVIKRKLLESRAVADAQVDYAGGRARISYHPGKTDPDRLIEAVNASGYQASLAGSKEE